MLSKIFVVVILVIVVTFVRSAWCDLMVSALLAEPLENKNYGTRMYMVKFSSNGKPLAS